MFKIIKKVFNMGIFDVTLQDSAQQNIIDSFSDMTVQIIQNVNKGAKPIKGGRGNPTIMTIGGENNFQVTIYNIPDSLPKRIINCNVILQNETEVLNFSKVTITVNDNTATFKTKTYKKTSF